MEIFLILSLFFRDMWLLQVLVHAWLLRYYTKCFSANLICSLVLLSESPAMSSASSIRLICILQMSASEQVLYERLIIKL